jgi:hypothetical protein
LKPTNEHDENIRHYHADDGFNDKATLKRRQQYQQTTCFSEVGTLHQNGIAEKD